MRNDIVDSSEGLIRVSDIETLDADGNLITQDLGFHMGFIGYNIRDLASTARVAGGSGWQNLTYYNHRQELIGHYWPLAHVEFREALVRCYDQLNIIPPIYGYTVTPVRSLVPPAESKYYNPASQSYPYNPGNPANPAAQPGTSTQILRDAGYTFVDADSSGSVTDIDYWTDPLNHEALPRMTIWTPLIGVAPTSFQHGLEFANDLTAIGLGATSANGYKGVESVGMDFNEYLDLVYGTADACGGQFDAFMVFYSLGRIPDHLYNMLHSSQECVTAPQMTNSAGVMDSGMDALCDAVKFELDPDAIEVAAKEIQLRMYDTDYSYALAYMVLYSRSYFNACDENLQGIVKSPGYGSDNSWTWLSMSWKQLPRVEDGKNVMVYINGDYPESFNQLYATTVYEWNIIGQTLDGLTAVNPYSHADIPWLASEWEVVESDSMVIHFTLESNVDWQDGWDFNATHAAWCLEFMRDWHIPRYDNTVKHIVDAVAVDATHLDVYVDEAGLSLFYDISGLAAYLPMHIWDRPWGSLANILNYDPKEPYNVASGYTAGPNPPLTNLFGTGPFVFKFWTGAYDDMERNAHYFKSQAAIAALLSNMCWSIGDHERNAVVNVVDLTATTDSYGYKPGDDKWDSRCDYNTDLIVEMKDLSNCAYHQDWRESYDASV